MESLDTHPMPLGEPAPPTPRRLQRVTPWADNVSRPWSETMPAPDANEVDANTASPIGRRIVRWTLVTVLLGLAAYALRGLLRH